MATRVDVLTDYPSLSCGHPNSSRTTIIIVGLEVVVFGLEEIRQSNLPIAVVIATHGRCNKKEHMEPFSHGLLGELGKLSASGAQKKRDVIVVTMDQRNHGTRLKDPRANLSYDQNERHLYDMAAGVVGGCQDVSLLIDFLSAYLFPHGERVIDEFIATGFSLGGNLTWRLLREDPRIRIGIPLLGLPFSSFAPYLHARATSMGLEWEPPIVPPTISAFLNLPVDADRYEGKKILSIHGGADELVPYGRGKGDIDAIQAKVGSDGMQVWLAEGVGHRLIPEMTVRTAEWVWKWAVRGDAPLAQGQDTSRL